MKKLFRLHSKGGDLKQALARRKLTELIFENFVYLKPFQNTLLKQKPWHLDGVPAVDEVVKMAARFQLLKPKNYLESPVQIWELADKDNLIYFMGGWLEELMALALFDAQCDSVRFSQPIQWTASVDGSNHMNEIDVIGQAGEKTVLVSCKAMSNLALERRKGESRIFDALQELSYWNMHFGGGNAICIFMTTADFYDEVTQTFRSAKLVERASVMNIHVISADFESYDQVLNRIKVILD